VKTVIVSNWINSKMNGSLLLIFVKFIPQDPVSQCVCAVGKKKSHFV